MKRIRAILAKEGPVIAAAFRQLSIPLLIAALYGLYEWHRSTGDFSVFAYIKTTVIALFFVMWFVGLYERHRKKLADSDAFSSLRGDISNLQGLVEKAVRNPHAQQTHAQGYVAKSKSLELIHEAEVLLGQGHTIASLLQASLAYEQAVRMYAERRGVSAENKSLSRVVSDIEDHLPEEWRRDLRVLRRIRNAIVHASPEQLEGIKKSGSLFNQFASAVALLNSDVAA